MDIYRVTVKSTNSVQPGDTFWQKEVLYCGEDRQEARVAYHKSKPHDFHRGLGNAARRTIVEVISDAGTEDFSDDTLEREHLQ